MSKKNVCAYLANGEIRCDLPDIQEGFEDIPNIDQAMNHYNKVKSQISQLQDFRNKLLNNIHTEEKSNASTKAFPSFNNNTQEEEHFIDAPIGFGQISSRPMFLNEEIMAMPQTTKPASCASKYATY